MKRSQKLLVSLASLVIGLPLIEFGLRTANFRHRITNLPPMIWNPKQDKLMRKGDYLFRGQAGQLWAPNPGASVPWVEGETINEEGYRGPLRSFDRTPGVLRIVTLGDSSTFGHSVRYEESYTAQLERELTERGVKVEVICAGVIGHSILQGQQRYQQLVRKFKPDAVVIAYGAINEHIPGPGALSDDEKIVNSFERADYDDDLKTKIRRLRIGHFAAWIADSIVEPETIEEAVDQGKLRRQHNKGYGLPTWPGIRHVEPKRFKQAIAEFHALVTEDGAQPIFISMPRRLEKEETNPILRRYTNKILQHCESTGAPLIDARTLFQDNERAGHPASDLLVDHVHPNPIGHGMIAEKLADTVQQLQREKGLKPRE